MDLHCPACPYVTKTSLTPVERAEVIDQIAAIPNAWHGRHHVPHIASLPEREGWN